MQEEFNLLTKKQQKIQEEIRAVANGKVSVMTSFQKKSKRPKIEEIASKVLGKKTGEPDKYDPTLLVAVPRNMSLEYINVKMEKLPGKGFDLWYSYEFRTLTTNGLPVAALIKFVIPHTSKNLIESKSFKLYCNSFANERLGNTKEEALKEACKIMRKDLNRVAATNKDDPITVSVVTGKEVEKQAIFENYKEITEVVDPRISIVKYQEDPKLLEVEDLGEEKEYRWKFDALKSNCLITHQPDSGTVYIYYKSKKHIKEESLVRYLTSFYGENHFHEQILISIFHHIEKLLNKNDSLFTTALYQRRGSLDIGPCQYKNIDKKSQEYEDIEAMKKSKVFAFDPNNLYR